MSVPFYTVLLLLCLRGLEAQAATFYAKTTGSDSNSCTQAKSDSTPKRTINAGIACLSGGDTLIVGNGKYDEVISDNGYPRGYSGTPPPAGRAGAYTTIKAQNVHGATIRANGDGEFRYLTLFDQASSHHIQLEGFVLDVEYRASGMGYCGAFGFSSDIYYVDIDCKNGGQGFFGTGSRINMIRVWSHGHGYDAQGVSNCCGGSECAPHLLSWVLSRQAKRRGGGSLGLRPGAGL